MLHELFGKTLFEIRPRMTVMRLDKDTHKYYILL
jgi:hypothetical protein